MSLAAGDRIGPYEVVERLGSGGMGEVYRARDEKLQRDIAVKILPAEYANDPEHLRRFEQEARAASALNHPNIITIHEIGTDQSLAYIAMELVEGESLRTLGARREASLKQVMRVAVKTAEGLAAAHERGIVHRDLKPENVMVSREGFVKILDFGLAKHTRPVSSTDVTMEATTPGVIFGTIGYMSPEQASGKRTDFRSDQFSFGVLLYELLANRHPFQHESAAETIAAILREDPRPLHEVDPSLPPELGRVVARCLEKDMGDRYASTRDLARDLREIRESLTRPGHSSDPVRTRPHLAPVRPRGRMIAGLAASAVVLAALVMLAVRSRDGAGKTPAAAVSAVRSLAVAGFGEKTGTSEGRMLVEGLSAGLSERLARARELRVVSPAQDTELASGAAEAVARKRGVDLLLRGDLQQDGERLRVGWRVVQAATGAQVAAGTVSGTRDDLFSLEERVATAVLAALSLRPPAASVPELRLSGEDQKRLVEAMGLLNRNGDPSATDEAIRRLESLLTNARDSASINGFLGQAYLTRYKTTRKQALLEQAELYTGRAVKLDPSLADAHVNAGELALTLGKNEEAEASFRRALTIRPDHPGAIVGLGDTYDALGRAADAEAQYERALALVPGWPNAYSRYGRFCFSRGKYDKAVSVFGTLTRLLPQSPSPFTNLGAAYHALGRYDDAVRSYQRAIAVRPTASAWSNLGTSQYAMGRYGDAAQSYAQAVQLAPDNYLLWANEGDAYRWSRQRVKAAVAYQRAIELGRKDLEINPSDALVNAVIGSSLAKLGRAAEAKKQIDAALRANPTDGVVLYHTAVAALLRGDSDAAVLWLSRAVEAGYMVADVEREPEFEPLRSRSDFKELLRPRRSS